jgi:hypothetical protein
MKLLIIYFLLGFIAGLITMPFYIVLTWQFWAVIFLVFIITLVIEYFVKKKKDVA